MNLRLRVGKSRTVFSLLINDASTYSREREKRATMNFVVRFFVHVCSNYGEEGARTPSRTGGIFASVFRFLLQFARSLEIGNRARSNERCRGFPDEKWGKPALSNLRRYRTLEIFYAWMTEMDECRENLGRSRPHLVVKPTHAFEIMGKNIGLISSCLSVCYLLFRIVGAREEKFFPHFSSLSVVSNTPSSREKSSFYFLRLRQCPQRETYYV